MMRKVMREKSTHIASITTRAVGRIDAKVEKAFHLIWRSAMTRTGTTINSVHRERGRDQQKKNNPPAIMSISPCSQREVWRKRPVSNNAPKAMQENAAALLLSGVELFDSWVSDGTRLSSAAMNNRVPITTQALR